MPDQLAPISLIQNSLASGELAPGLWARLDVSKVRQGAIVMRNFFVDYKGGASTRPGTQYLGQAGSTGYVRLIPFMFSSDIGQTYMLVFSNLKLRFIKNPGGTTYPNSSNAAFIESSPGVPYEIATPYAEADLPYIKYSQIADEMTITRHGYARRLLSRVTDTNWTLTTITNTTGPSAPTISAINLSATIAPDPGNTRYMYCVTAVDSDGNESLPSVPFVSAAGLNLALSQGNVTVFWGAVANAVYYRVYKALPASGGKVPSAAEQMGFAGFSYGTYFRDNNIVPDFTLSPPSADNPFANSKIVGYSISATSADWPVGGTTISIADATGTGAVIYPILDNDTAAGVGNIIGLYIANPGQNYTAPTLTALGGGTTFTATATLSASSGNDPDVVGLFQQRQVYASTTNDPLSVFASRPAALNDFRKTNPTVDNDAYTFTLASQQINDIVWLQSMPGGLVIASNSGIVQLTGGSQSAANPAAVTPSSAVVVPQSFYGAADIHPIVIDYDILYVQSEGSVVRDLQYNFFVNIYTGTDVTILSSHLFYPLTIVDWAYQDTPFKVIWAVREDGALLSLTWLKGQEIAGWARHDTNGLVEAVAVVREGPEDAIYLSVNRSGTRFIERLCDRIYYQIDDCWCLDAALSTTSNYPAATILLSAATGNVTVTASVGVFAPGDVGKVIRAVGGKALITGFTNATHVNATVIYAFGGLSLTSGSWRMDPVVASVGGLAHLNGYTVYALADGVVQGPFTVVAGSITLTTPASQVVVGILYQCQLQPIYLDVEGQNTIQGRLKKNTAVTLRVASSARVKFGSSFGTVREFIPGVSSTDPAENLTDGGTNMLQGDVRQYIDPIFDRLGTCCVQQDYPLPCTLLALIPEYAQGDTR